MALSADKTTVTPFFDTDILGDKLSTIYSQTVSDILPRISINDPTVFPVMPITKLLADVLHVNKNDKVVDICTGSGYLAIIAALRGAKAVVGIDINPAAIATAIYNAKVNGVDDKTTFLLSDFFSSLTPQQFDLIISNPPCMPFINDFNNSNFNLQLAVDGGPDGTSKYIYFLNEAKKFLSPSGRIIFPIPKWCNYQIILDAVNENYDCKILEETLVHFWLKEYKHYIIDLWRQKKCELVFFEGEPYAEVLACELRKKPNSVTSLSSKLCKRH